MAFKFHSDSKLNLGDKQSDKYNMLKYNRQFLKLLLMAFLSLKGAAFAVESTDILLFDNELSAFYQRGEYLVYDCVGKHWVCTGERENDRCVVSRKNAILDNKDSLPCAVVKKLKNHKVCTVEQGKLINENMQNRFCMHPKLRQRYRSY
jgi:hypothetical protein